MLCNIIATYGANQSHNTNEIYDVLLYQSIRTFARKTELGQVRVCSVSIRPSVCHTLVRSSVVCLSVGRSVCHNLEPCKTAEPIDMPFRVWTRVGARNNELDGGLDLPREGAVLRGNVICTAND